MPRFLLTLLLVSLCLPAQVRAQPRQAGVAECPDALVRAARVYRRDLQEEQYAIRDSSKDSPAGIEPTMVFDLAAHECHSMPGQAYKVFGQGACRPGRQEGVYRIVYPYNLYYRKAPRAEELYDLEWNEGSDGLWQVTFEWIVDSYRPVGQKEMLDLPGRKNGHKGPSTDGANPR